MTPIKQIKKSSPMIRTMLIKDPPQDKDIVNLLDFVIHKTTLKWICPAALFITTAIIVENTKNSSHKFSKMIQRITTQ